MNRVAADMAAVADAVRTVAVAEVAAVAEAVTAAAMPLTASASGR
jgi:hypothetical protein